MVRLDKDGVDFRILGVSPPYALIWYSVYGAIGAMDGYTGAQEIDKCVARLAIVSTSAWVLESMLNFGPGMAVKAHSRNEACTSPRIP